MKEKVKECERGYTIILTGNGKGKTTSALGMALRAAGRGVTVLFVQFLKNAEYGEHVSLKAVPNISVHIFGRGFCKVCGDKLPFSEHKKGAEKALSFVRSKMKNKRIGMIILDEVNCAIAAKLLSARSVCELVHSKPSHLHLVLTGRGAPASLIKKADLVSEVLDVKHPFKKGIAARAGIEF
jgi:cob(I)alamin adenosyltransferase